MASDEIVHVIDDDADVRQSLAFLLSTVGLAVRVHESATSLSWRSCPRSRTAAS